MLRFHLLAAAVALTALIQPATASPVMPEVIELKPTTVPCRTAPCGPTGPKCLAKPCRPFPLPWPRPPRPY